MNLSQQPVFADFTPHLHLDNEICPTCEQIIPNDRLEQVKARRAAQEHELENRYALKAKAEQEQLLNQVRQEQQDALAKLRQESEANEAAARIEARKAATAEMEMKLSAATAATQTANAQVEEFKRQLEVSAAATAAKVNEARAEAVRQAEITLQPQLIAAQSATQAALNQARALAEKDEAAQSQIKQLQLDVSSAREEAKKAAEVELESRLAAVNVEKQAAIDAKAAAELQIQTLRDEQQKAINERVQEAREALDKSHRDSFNAEQAKHFEEKQKIQSKLDEVQRQLENKTAQELGEGAEVNLFDALKAEFLEDDITRVGKGAPGADIRHMVRHNGKECGLILYDSKNHKAWRSEFVTKLRDDQIGDKADHAILSSIAFPQGTKQVHIQDNVIIVNPARAVAIAQLVRRHVVQAHCLKLSNDDRERKSLELYSFITSERFGTLMAKLQATTESLNQLDVAEQATHNKVWQKRGQLIGSVVKTQADLRCEIDRIVGTADDATDNGLEAVLNDIAGTGE